MTIDEIVKEFAHIKYVGDGFSEYTQEKQEAVALNEAENIMRKYQKIEEIVSNYGFDTSWLCLKKIREVMEGGNNNTDGKKLC